MTMRMNPAQMNNLRVAIQDRMSKILAHIQMTQGFPLDTFEDTIAAKTLMEQLLFVNGYLERHPGVSDPILFSDL